MSTPPAVKTLPLATMLELSEVSEPETSWKCSVRAALGPAVAGLALAAVSPQTAMAAAMTGALAAAASLLA